MTVPPRQPDSTNGLREVANPTATSALVLGIVGLSFGFAQAYLTLAVIRSSTSNGVGVEALRTGVSIITTIGIVWFLVFGGLALVLGAIGMDRSKGAIRTGRDHAVVGFFIGVFLLTSAGAVLLYSGYSTLINRG